jgi:sialate O-acetylesterase
MQRRSHFGCGSFVIAFALAGIFQVQADVKMPAIFGDHMVLQQELKVPVWGKAAPGEKVTVTAGEQTVSATADASGKWRVDLAPFAPNTPAITVKVVGHNTLTFQDVLIGDVWLASGQSNMEFALAHGGTHPEDNTGYLGGVLDAANEDAKAIDPQMRIFYVAHKMSVTPVDDVVGKWELCTPESIADFSGVAYYFGREIRNEFHRPVGLIGSYTVARGPRRGPASMAFKKIRPFRTRSTRSRIFAPRRRPRSSDICQAFFSTA